VFPFLRLPIHMTYLWYLHQFSPRIARAYVSTAMQACQLLGVGPSILLHPLDFLGMEDEPEMKFFPGMNLPKSQKLGFLCEFWEIVAARFNVVPMRDHAAQVASQFSGGTLVSESAARRRGENSAEARELVAEGT
jgi:peptidoglycan-N-acetylglucosamine deacetylase